MEDLACLPIWYADGDGLCWPSAYNNDYLKLVKVIFRSYSWNCLPNLRYSNTFLYPYSMGWNHAIRKRMLQMGVDESVLCCSELINHIRTPFHRSSWVDVLSILNPNELYCGNPHYFTEIISCCFLKKGTKNRFKISLYRKWQRLNWYNGLLTGSLSGWINRTIELQGGIYSTEPYYNKELDFAMEFYANECGEISFIGYSLFRTNSAGSTKVIFFRSS